MVEKLKPTCKKCGTVLTGKAGAGRPAIYCSSGCRRAVELEVRRLQSHLIRLETEAEACRRDRSGLMDVYGASTQERASDIAHEIQRAEARLRALL
jgi:hypothetical protein